jgi:hypothetical protein
MSTSLSIPESNAAAEPTAPAVLCEMCPHEMEGHDALSRRFCRATAAGALTRGCICTAR